MNKWIPAPSAIVREGIIVLGGLLLAAMVLSRFPKLKTWVSQQGTVTVQDGSGNTLY